MPNELELTSDTAKETANAPRAWVAAVTDTFLDIDLVSVLNSGLYNLLAHYTQPRDSCTSFGGFISLLAAVSFAIFGTALCHLICQVLIEHFFPNLIRNEVPPEADFILNKYSPTSDVLFWFALLWQSTMLLAMGWCILLVINRKFWRVFTGIVLLTAMAFLNLLYHRVVGFFKLPHLVLSGIQTPSRVELAWWGWALLIVFGCFACVCILILRVKKLRGVKSGLGRLATYLVLFLTGTFFSAAGLAYCYVLDYYESYHPQLFKKMDIVFFQNVVALILLIVQINVWLSLHVSRLFMRRPIDSKDADVVRNILEKAGFKEPELSQEMSWRTVIERDGHVVGLTLQRCRNLKYLSRMIGKLSRLRRLTLDDCQNLVFLPPEVGKLSSLTKISLSGCDQLKIPKQDIVQSADDDRIIAFMKNLYLFHKERFAEIGRPLREEKDIIHAAVLHRDYAKAVESAVRGDKSLAYLREETTGRTARSLAVKECGNAIAAALAFNGRYELKKPPSYESKATCKVFLAKDYRDFVDENEPRPVVLKFVYREKDFRSEMQVRRDIEGQARFLDEHVVTAIRFYDGSIEGDNDSIAFRKAVDSEPDLTDEGVKPMYCLVLKQGERNLEERIHAISCRPDSVRAILRKLAQCLRHIHDCGYVHCDFKPKNIVWDGTSDMWKLIDFNASVQKSTELQWDEEGTRWTFDSDQSEAEPEPNLGKKTSTAYAPPEMLTKRPGRSPEVRRSCVRCLSSSSPAGWWCAKAHESFDAWSFGVVMFQLVAGFPLFSQSDEKHDNLSKIGLEKLVNWNVKTLDNTLSAVPGINQSTKELLERLLDPDPRRRPSMENVLTFDYFNLDKKLEDIENELRKAHEAGKNTVQLQEVRTEIVTRLEKIQRVVSGNAARLVNLALEVSAMRHELADFQELTGKMFSEIIEAKSVPKYVFIVPVHYDTLWQKAIQWGQIKNWFELEVNIYFVCPVTLKVADGEEKKVFFQRNWVKKYGPALVMSLRVLSVACAVGRLTGLPLPSLGDVVDQVKDKIGEHTEVLTSLLEGLRQETELAEVFAWAEEKVNEFTKLEDAAPAPSDVPENLRLSYDHVRELYKDDLDFTSSGLTKTFCEKDGTVEFVRPEAESLYKERGAACIGIPEKELDVELKRQ